MIMPQTCVLYVFCNIVHWLSFGLNFEILPRPLLRSCQGGGTVSAGADGAETINTGNKVQGYLVQEQSAVTTLQALLRNSVHRVHGLLVL